MLRDKLMEALKNKKKDLSDSERDAKMDVVKDLRKSAMDSMKDRLNGVKKVSVMSDSEEGLKEGLDKAEDIISGDESSEEENDDIGPQGESDEMDEFKAMDHDSLMKHIEKLQEIANSKKEENI